MAPLAEEEEDASSALHREAAAALNNNIAAAAAATSTPTSSRSVRSRATTGYVTSPHSLSSLASEADAPEAFRLNDSGAVSAAHSPASVRSMSTRPGVSRPGLIRSFSNSDMASTRLGGRRSRPEDEDEVDERSGRASKAPRRNEEALTRSAAEGDSSEEL